MFKFNKLNESGRSMVEMLGVLAIVGVLSVAGIAGYTTAMNSHRANEAINRVMRLAILVSSQKQLGQPASLSSEDADVTLTQEDGKFTLTLSGLSPAVRTKIASMDLGTATLGTDDQGNPTFTFSNDLGNAPTLVENTMGNFEGKDVTEVAERRNCYVSGTFNNQNCYLLLAPQNEGPSAIILQRTVGCCEGDIDNPYCDYSNISGSGFVPCNTIY